MTVKELKKKVNAKTNNMARKAKGSGFKMKSGNTTSFKTMGSSPVKYTNPTTGESLNPYAPDVIQNMEGMGVSGDVVQQIIKDKTNKEEEKIESGQKIDTKDQIEKNVSKVEDIKKVKPKKTNMEKLRAKQKRMSKGQSEYQYRQTKEYKDSKKSKQKAPKGQETVSSTTSKMVDKDNDGISDFIQAPKPKVVKTSELSFGDAFAAAHKKFGPGKEFEWPKGSGDKYTTNRADDNDYGKYKHTDKIMENFSTTPEVILTDEFNNPVETVEEELKNKGFNYGDNKFDYSPNKKKSPYKKGIGKYAKKAKGKRGYKMKRK